MLRINEIRVEMEMKHDGILHMEKYMVYPVYQAMNENGLKVTQFILQEGLNLDNMTVVDVISSVPKSVIKNIIDAIPEALKNSGYENKIEEVKNFWNVILNK